MDKRIRHDEDDCYTLHVYNEFTNHDMENRHETKETANMRLGTLHPSFVDIFISSMYFGELVLEDIAKARRG